MIVMKKYVYVLLKPDNMDTANARNYHVIKAKQDIDTGALSYPDGTTVMCGSWEKKTNASVLPSQVHPFDDENMRLVLAEKQNDGLPICANCAKHFYADGV